MYRHPLGRKRSYGNQTNIHIMARPWTKPLCFKREHSNQTSAQKHKEIVQVVMTGKTTPLSTYQSSIVQTELRHLCSHP